MTFSVERLRNVANITAATSQALSGSLGALPSGATGGLGLAGVGLLRIRRHKSPRLPIGQITRFRRRRWLLA